RGSRTSRQLPSAAGATGAHPERRWAHPAARYPCCGGQGPSASGADDPRAHLRGGIPGLLVRLPAPPVAARRSGCPRCALQRKVNWVLDADIRAFFDTIDHECLKRFVEHRIGDTRLVRLLMKWLHAGVMEGEELRAVTEGTPQGGIISPLLA